MNDLSAVDLRNPCSQFTSDEIKLWNVARQLVEPIPGEIEGDRVDVMHLARAVGQIMDRPVQDGFYGGMPHTWLWTGNPNERDLKYFSVHGWTPATRILDIKVPWTHPNVLLVDSQMSLPDLPFYRTRLRPELQRIPEFSIDKGLMSVLVEMMS